MKITLLIIAFWLNGTLQPEAAYPMSNIIECERVATLTVVKESYPGRVLYCMQK